MRQTSTRSVIRYASMKRGRTWRNRKRNFANEINECVPLNEFEQNYGRLKQWMKIKSNGLLKTCCLEPRDFKSKPISEGRIQGRDLLSCQQLFLTNKCVLLCRQLFDVGF